MRTTPKGPEMTVKCPKCGASKKILYMQCQVGEMLTPYPGGGEWGRCWRCKNEGLQVIEIPTFKPATPNGWTSVPS